MSSSNHVFTLLPFQWVALEAGLTSRDLQTTISNNHVSRDQQLSLPLVKYRQAVSNNVLVFWKRKKIQNIGRYFPFSSFLAVHHIYVAIYHMSSCLIITLDCMFLRNCCNYTSSSVSDSFWDFWWKWLTHAIEPTCIQHLVVRLNSMFGKMFTWTCLHKSCRFLFK